MDLDQREQEAALFLNGALPQFKELVGTLTKNQLERVLKAVVEVPLNEKQFVFYDAKEKKAFELGTSIVNQKTVLVAIVQQKRQSTEAQASSTQGG